jgi:hypothetical protein
MMMMLFSSETNLSIDLDAMLPSLDVGALILLCLTYLMYVISRTVSQGPEPNYNYLHVISNSTLLPLPADDSPIK